MDLHHLNWVAIGTGALGNFLVGGLWYSPLLFGNAWMKSVGFTEEQMKNRPMGRIFGLTFVYSVVMAFNMALFLMGRDISYGAAFGFHAGLGLATMAVFIIGLFEGRTARNLLIHAGYLIISMTLMGVIITAWN